MPKKKVLEEAPKGEIKGVDLEEERLGLNEEDDAGEAVVEFAVEDAEVQATKWPLIRNTICEFCGVPVKGMYTDKKGHPLNCKHYDKLKVHCSYCRKSPFHEDCQGRTFHVYSLADDPKRLIVTCDDYRCLNKHQRRAREGKV